VTGHCDGAVVCWGTLYPADKLHFHGSHNSSRLTPEYKPKSGSKHNEHAKNEEKQKQESEENKGKNEHKERN
jgi:hypothetical protein